MGQTNAYISNTTLAANGSLTLLSVATGNSGLIRNIHLITDMNASGRSEIMNVSFNIKYDGESTPSVSVPVGSLIGWEDTARLDATTFKTPFFSVDNHGPSGKLGSSFTLRYPIPYTNGIAVYLTANASAVSHQWWSNIFYQDSLASCWNSNLRFFASRSNENVAASATKAGTVSLTAGSGTVVGNGSTNFLQSWVSQMLEVNGERDDLQILSIEDTHNLTVRASEVKDTVNNQTFNLAAPHTFFTRAAGKRGWIASTNAYFHPANVDTYYLEGNTRIFVDQETSPSLTWSGVEDYGGSSFYFETNFQDDTGGIISYEDVSTGNVDFYRLFWDHPIRYVNGVTGQLPNLGGEITTMNWTTVYYEEVS